MITGLLKHAVGAMAVAAVLATAPASARSLDDILKSGKIQVGVNPSYPPLALYDQKNEIDGFDVAIARKLAEMLGVKLELVIVTSPNRIPFVTSGKIDYVMGAMTRTPDRAKVIDFTVPIHTEVLGVLTTAGKNYKHWKDLNDPAVRLIETRGSTGAKFVQDNLPKAQLQIIDDIPDVIRVLAQGRADAHINIIDFLGEHMKNHKVEWKVLDSKIDVYYCSLGLAKGNDTLRNWLNVAIFDLQRSGFIDDAWKKWFGMDMLEKLALNPNF